MFTYIDFLAYQEHHKDLLREAERERLARLAVSAQTARKAEKKAAKQDNVQSNTVKVLCCEAGTA